MFRTHKRNPSTGSNFYCKLFVLVFVMYYRYKDLINNFPEEIKHDRYIGLVLNKIAQYGSVCFDSLLII